MNKQKFITLNRLYALVILFFAQNLCAANFNITPLGTLPTSVTTGQTVVANYTLTNLTHTARNGYVLQGLPATVTQNTTNPYCSNPINLGPNASCQLQLNITGAVSSNFAICKEYSCTTAATPLNVFQSGGPGAPSYAYITDNQQNIPYVSLCTLNTTTGSIVSCQNAGGDSVLVNAIGLGGIVLNNSGTIAYMSSSGMTNNVFQCTINQITKEFSACSSTTINSQGGYAPMNGGLTLNNAGTIAFLVNDLAFEIIACPIVSGTITDNCVNTNATFSSGLAPTKINLNQEESVAYIGSASGGLPVGITKCSVSGTSFSSCANITGDGIFSFNEPSGVALNNTGSSIYVTDNAANVIYICSTAMNGANFTSCIIANNTITRPWTITLNANNTVAYINDKINTTYTCAISDVDGTLSNCLTSTYAPDPSSTALLY